MRSKSAATLVLALFALALAIVPAGKASAASSYTVYRAEAESFVPSGGTIIEDPTAQLGKAIALPSGATMSRGSLTPSADRVVVIAKAMSCLLVHPKLDLKIDHVTVGSV